MQEPTLVILAAGMGSRFGGLKQIKAVDGRGHAIIDFSLYDAYRAGFRKVAFVIKHEIEEDFKNAVGRRMEKYFDVSYVFQQLDRLPEGCAVPEGRVKPWGTGHAVACCAGTVDGPFAVINADDFYGPGAYRALYDYLVSERPENEHAMVAYFIAATLSISSFVFISVAHQRILPSPRGSPPRIPSAASASRTFFSSLQTVTNSWKNSFCGYAGTKPAPARASCR